MYVLALQITFKYYVYCQSAECSENLFYVRSLYIVDHVSKSAHFISTNLIDFLVHRIL